MTDVGMIVAMMMTRRIGTVDVVRGGRNGLFGSFFYLVLLSARARFHQNYGLQCFVLDKIDGNPKMRSKRYPSPLFSFELLFLDCCRRKHRFMSIRETHQRVVLGHQTVTGDCGNCGYSGQLLPVLAHQKHIRTGVLICF